MLRSFFFILISLISGCDLLTSGDPRPASIELEPRPSERLEVGSLEVLADTSGSFVFLLPDVSARPVIADAGIWIAAVQDGQVRASLRALGATNLVARDGDRRLGVFKLDPDSLRDIRVTNWPVEYGAPADDKGQPQISGDMMLWSAFLSSNIPVGGQPEELFNSPLKDVLISVSVYGYGSPALRDAIFIRFKISNRGSIPLTDTGFGFYADVDLDRAGCYSLARNAVGYDIDRTITYTYPIEARGDAPMQCEVPAIAYTILQPSPTEITRRVSSHPILGKNVEVYEFSEATLRTPQDVSFRLKGLSSSGEPMIDPLTGEPAQFAFTGDPVEKTGWLGFEGDVRSLLVFAPFTLQSLETREFIVVVVAKQSPTLSESLALVRSQLDDIDKILSP